MKAENKKVELVTEGIQVSDMQPNALYLDGAVRGTVIDVKKNSFSFDHHGEGIRFDKTSSCLQMALAVIQGLDMDTIHSIYVSSIDCDSVLATLVALYPEITQDLQLIHFLQDISRIDNHGFPALVVGEPVYPCFFKLSADPRNGEEESTELLLKKVELANKLYVTGDLFVPGADRKLPGVAVALSSDGDIVKRTEGEVSFADVYKHSGIGILFNRDSNGTLKVTVGKKPFVDVPDLRSLWSHMSTFEPQGKTWGGADSIGGSPFQDGTCLSENDVVKHISSFLPSMQ